jgi:hypothetical protein
MNPSNLSVIAAILSQEGFFGTHQELEAALAPLLKKTYTPKSFVLQPGEHYLVLEGSNYCENAETFQTTEELEAHLLTMLDPYDRCGDIEDHVRVFIVRCSVRLETKQTIKIG